MTESEGKLVAAHVDAPELPEKLTPKAIADLFGRDDLYTARAVFARLKNFGYELRLASSSPASETGREPVAATLANFNEIIAALRYDGSDENSLTVGEIRRALV